MRPHPSYLPLFPDSYWAGTRHLTLEEHGAHLNLMMHAWEQKTCSLPNDDDRLGRILGISKARWLKLKPAVMALWILEDDRWTQERLGREWAKICTRRLQQSMAASVRWNGSSR